MVRKDSNTLIKLNVKMGNFVMITVDMVFFFIKMFIRLFLPVFFFMSKENLCFNIPQAIWIQQGTKR